MITDTVQSVLEVWSAIVNADTELRTLFGRTSGLIVPADSEVLNPALPIIAYAVTNEGINEQGQPFLDLQLSCWAALQATANKAASRLKYLADTPGVTWNAFNAQGLDVCSNPARRPNRLWPGAQSEPGDPAECRNDVLVSFLIPG